MVERGVDRATPDGPTPGQREVARMFFGLAESQGFLLAGGAALAIQGLTARPTGDLDFFTADPGTVLPAMQALVDAAARRGWATEVFHAADSYARIAISAAEVVEVDFAMDSRPERPPVVTVMGPSLDPFELAGHKLLALFGRALPRDLADVHDLAARFGTAALVQTAADIDAGFDTHVLGEMIRHRLALVDDDEIPHRDPAAVRAFHTQWSDTLLHDPAADPQAGAAAIRPPAPPTTRWQPGHGQPTPEQPGRTDGPVIDQ